MSFIVKGIDLPKGGEKLKIEIEPDGTVWIDQGSEWEKHEGGAVQILRPHGRLIDWDAFNSKLDIQYAEGRGKTLAPTILKAEGKG